MIPSSAHRNVRLSYSESGCHYIRGGKDSAGVEASYPECGQRLRQTKRRQYVTWLSELETTQDDGLARSVTLDKTLRQGTRSYGGSNAMHSKGKGLRYPVDLRR
jgi:hypothetical protein